MDTHTHKLTERLTGGLRFLFEEEQDVCLTFHSGTPPQSPSSLSLTGTQAGYTASGHSHTCQRATKEVTAGPHCLGCLGHFENDRWKEWRHAFSLAPPSLPDLYVQLLPTQGATHQVTLTFIYMLNLNCIGGNTLAYFHFIGP